MTRIIDSTIENYYSEPISDDAFYNLTETLLSKVRISTEAKAIVEVMPLVYYTLLVSECYANYMFETGFKQEY